MKQQKSRTIEKNHLVYYPEKCAAFAFERVGLLITQSRRTVFFPRNLSNTFWLSVKTEDRFDLTYFQRSRKSTSSGNEAEQNIGAKLRVRKPAY